jgi:hypothetical protein
MFTIVTRKSLAFGAIVALATTAFAGTPASAAGEINVVPSAGTSYSTLITDTFVVETSFAPGVVNGNSQLKYQIKTAKAASFQTDAANTAATVSLNAAVAGATGDASDATAFVQYVSGTATLATERNFLGLKLSGITYTSDSVDAVVTAFVDSNNDGKLSTGEWATAKTVSFKKYADVTAVIALDDVKVGDKTAKGRVTLTGLNQAQVQSEVKLSFKKSATASLDSSDAGDRANSTAAANGLVATSTDAGEYVATTGTVDSTDGFDTGDTVYLTALVDGKSVGTAVTKTATARTISKFEASVDANDNGTVAGLARLNSAFSISSVVYDTATTAAPIGGVAVTATLDASDTAWDTTAGSEQTVTVNGTKYTTYAAYRAAALALTADASGKTTVSIVPSNFASGDTFDVTFNAQNITSSRVRATQSPAFYTVADVASASVRKIAKNTSATLNYTVKDQFGVSATATNLRLVVTSALKTQFVAVSAGKAAVTVTPTTDSTDAVTVAVALQASTVDANQQTLWAGSTDAINAGNITINVSAVADDFDTAPAVYAINNVTTGLDTAKQALENKAFTATDFPVAVGASLAEIRGSVNTQGAEVTVSGTDVAFVVGGKVYAGTVTFPAGASAGDFAVLVAGHKAGASTVTFKTGAITKTVALTFDAAVVASLKNTVVAAPSAAQAGRAVTVSATLTDAYGNAIAGKTVKFAVAGVGSLSSSDAVTDASGVATVRLVSSYGEDGDAVVTVSHNGGDNATDTATQTTKDDFTLAKTITFGITDAQIDNVGKRVTAVASFSKGKTVSFYVNGEKKWSKLSASDADVVLNYNLKKGRNTVTLKISGGFVTSEVIVVK